MQSNKFMIMYWNTFHKMFFYNIWKLFRKVCIILYLTKNELEIMDVLWTAGRALTRGELMELSVDKSWKSSSVHILLNSLLKKGAIAEAGFARCGKTCGRTYAAAVSVDEYYVSTFHDARYETDTVKLFEAIYAKLSPSPVELEESLSILASAR